MAVLGVPSSASRWISLSATISDVVRDRPYGVSAIESESGDLSHLVNGSIRALAELLQLDIVPVQAISDHERAKQLQSGIPSHVNEHKCLTEGWAELRGYTVGGRRRTWLEDMGWRDGTKERWRA